LAALPRVSEVLVKEALEGDVPDGVLPDGAASATYELTFRRDEAGRPVVLGRVQGALPLECQRCLGVVIHQVDAQVHLILVRGDTAGDFPEPYEPLPVVADRVSLADLVEDELLLALPQIAMHPPEVCHPAVQVQGPAGAGSAEAAEDLAKRPNPFAALAGWKSETNN
jgi:uncharacterized protein